MFSKPAILFYTSLLTLPLTNALPADTVPSVLPRDAPTHSTRTCSSAGASIQKPQTCAGFAQESVMFTTTQDVSDSVLDMIAEAVKASGGSVVQRYGMKGFKGLAINAPVKVLDLVEAFGAGRGFKMEADCKVHILPSAQGAKSGSGI
ncbi:hypothetical protein Vi05172_g10619 [Venturia inaequalis]|uniref:Uncharacterized protein n=2 Tax=Venturia inaequalis TaxID=5025 RepID=A0A8H3ZE64_VENIN|nr:hypothetical protein EG327_001965 [Venturia inaequalis]RDI79344.1 hypothetical protein Vi05172_g10619 [Venturia inaequalis]